MEGSKLISILKTFSGKEFKDYGKYLDSPLFNKSNKIRMTHKFLSRYYPDFKSPDFNKENLFTLLYPEENYNDRKVRNILNLMLNLTKDYMAYLEFRQNKFDSYQHILKQLNARNLRKIFEHELNCAIEVSGKLKMKDEDYYYRMYELENLRQNYYDNIDIVDKRKMIYSSIVKGVENIIIYFLIILLKDYLKMLNIVHVFKIEPEKHYLEDLINYLINNFEIGKTATLIEVINIFLRLYKEEVKLDTVVSIKELINQNKKNLKKDDYKFLFIELYNYCKRRQSEGNKEFGELSFQLMKEMLDNDIFIENDGYMLDHTYINLASSAFRVNEIEWAEKFINSYKVKLYPETKDSAYNYIQAVLYFMIGKSCTESKTKNYEMAIKYLSEVKSEHLYYYPRVKNLYLIIYYELDDIISAEYIIDTYKHYIKHSQKIPEHLRERYLNFINYVHRLIKLKENYKTGNLQSLKNEILRNINIEYKGWLLEKLEELVKK